MTSRTKFLAIAAAFLLVGGLAWGIYAIEADREVRILCGLFTPGTSEPEMDRILSTANLLRVEESRAGDALVRKVYSRVNLGRNGCVVELDGGVVRSLQRWPGDEERG